MVRASLEENGARNLEAVELGLREAMAKDACRLLESLYSDPDLSIPGNSALPGEKRHRQRSKEVETIFGKITLRRDYFYRERPGGEKSHGRAPLDEALGLVNGYSPALVRLASRMAARIGFEQGSQDLAEIANIHLEGRQIQRLANEIAPQIVHARDRLSGVDEKAEPIPILYIALDGTGVPMMPPELAGRRGKQPDGTAKTREVKLSAIFTQTSCDEKGNPARDYQSTTYLASFRTAAEFGALVRAEAIRRGMGRAVKVVVLGDGAAWIWELARVNFGFAVQILDLYHALERLHELCHGFYGTKSPETELYKQRWKEKLLSDRVDSVIEEARNRLHALGAQPDDTLEKQIAFFENHRHQMLYLTYHNQGFFYGSGVVEAGCKTVIGQRCKQSGMFWSEAGAQNILDLRCALMSRQWDLCWDGIHKSDYLRLRTVA